MTDNEPVQVVTANEADQFLDEVERRDSARLAEENAELRAHKVRLEDLVEAFAFDHSKERNRLLKELSDSIQNSVRLSAEIVELRERICELKISS